MRNREFDKHEDRVKRIKMLLSLLLVTFLATGFCACSVLDVMEIKSDDNTVSGTIELSNRINEEAKSGVDEVILYIENATEDEIKNITGNMGMFWGTPTEYTILDSDSGDGTLKIKFFIEKSNNYYVVNKYLNGRDIPEKHTEAEAILKKVQIILKKIIKKDMTDYEKELAIHDWLVKKIQYDDSIDASSTENGSYGAMVEKKTMCRGYAESMKLLAECCGLKTQVIVGTAIDPDGHKIGHAWNLVKLEDQWYHLDVTYDDPVGDNGKDIHYYYFNLNDSDINKDHYWEKEYFPACNNDSYMYYKENGLYYTDHDAFQSSLKKMIENDRPSFTEVLLDEKKITESQLQFIFNTGSVKSLSWSTHSSDPVILTIIPNYY